MKVQHVAVVCVVGLLSCLSQAAHAAAPVAVEDNYGRFFSGANVLDNDSDADDDPLSADLVSQPQGGTVFLQTNGVFEYTPDEGFSGPDTFQYRAEAAGEFSNVVNVYLQVGGSTSESNTPPVAVDDNYGGDYLGQNVLSNDSDAEGDPLAADLVSQPLGGTVFMQLDGTFSYTPNEGFSGSDSFQYRAVANGDFSNIATVTLFVEGPANSPPVAQDDSYGVDYQGKNVLANDTDIDEDPLTAILVTQPELGTVTLNSDGTFTYTPNTGASGNDVFTYQASDGTDLSNVATVSLLVEAPANSAPVAQDDNFGFDYQGRNVLANDTDVDEDPLTAILVTPIQNGSLTLNSDGSFSYTPATGFSGTDSFTYQASDGSELSNTATVTLQVEAPAEEPVPLNPVALDDNFGADFAGRNVLANDEDPSGAGLVALLEQGPANGTVQLNSSGTFTYEPNAGFVGEDVFSYRASNGELLSDVATVTLLVVDATVTPAVAVDDEFEGDFSGANLITNDLYANPQDLAAIKVTDPGEGSLEINPDGSFTYRPFAGFTGNDSFTYLVRDPDGLESNVATVLLTVDGNTAGEGGLAAKKDADGTSVLVDATPNELAVARRFDDICTRLDPANADQQDLLTLCANLRKQGTTAKQALDALRVITPEELAAIGKTVRVLSFSQFRNHGSRMARVREGSRGVSLAGLDLNYENSRVSGSTLDALLQESLGMGASGDEMLAGSRLGVFVTGDLSFGDQDRTGLESGFDFDSQTLTVGMDYRLTDNAFVGTSLSIGQAEVTFDQQQGETTTDNQALAVYGSLYSGNGYVDGIFSYGWSDVDTERNISYQDFGGSVERTAAGSTDGSEYYVSVNAGYSFSSGALRLDPVMRFFYLDGSVDGFTETGAQGLNLAVSDNDFQSMTVSASGQLSYMFLPGWGVITPYLRLEYTRELEDSAAGVRYRFVNDPFADSTLQIRVDDPDTSYMVYGAGVAAQFAHGFSGFVSYQALGGYDGLSGETVSFGARWELAF
ncbi:hypothetical protein CWI75_15230 [Kineobactrum sediminis]|uniref:Autotransporter domain-containing protein n=1 Tax=Kineobactrum sediminis TaxID=1905677 RepID=A0A2N5XZQ3_9GAMM|nr:Ig-like domain-containing protein [Kineobactrum sediminis]PLW81579.1 hypothetical protein CWI75_15230 [Kineobactrum sediminis]